MADKVLFPFGQADTAALSGTGGTLSVSNSKTIASIAPSGASTITVEADDELPIGSEVDVAITVGGTAYNIAFAGDVNSYTLASGSQTASTKAMVTLVYDGSVFWVKSVKA